MADGRPLDPQAVAHLTLVVAMMALTRGLIEAGAVEEAQLIAALRKYRNEMTMGGVHPTLLQGLDTVMSAAGDKDWIAAVGALH